MALHQLEQQVQWTIETVNVDIVHDEVVGRSEAVRARSGASKTDTAGRDAPAWCQLLCIFGAGNRCGQRTNVKFSTCRSARG
jgi:hypothetical protein